jgi:putative transposase
VVECCRALRVSPSGFYAWQQRPESARATQDRQLRVQIHASHAASRGRYGRPRVWKDRREAGLAPSARYRRYIRLACR